MRYNLDRRGIGFWLIGGVNLIDVVNWSMWYIYSYVSAVLMLSLSDLIDRCGITLIDAV